MNKSPMYNTNLPQHFACSLPCLKATGCFQKQSLIGKAFLILYDILHISRADGRS